MKLGLLVLVICFSATSFAMTKDEALATFDSEQTADEVFGMKIERTVGLDSSLFNNKRLTVVSVQDETMSMVLELKDNRVVIGAQSAPLMIKTNVINLDVGEEMCKSACLILPKDLESLEGYVPGVMMTIVSFFGPGVPSYVPVVIKVEELK